MKSVSLNKQAGFSLLELLGSLAILSMITVSISSSMTTGRRVWERSATLVEITDQAITRQHLRSLLEAMPEPNAFTSATEILSGTGTGFRFIVPAVSFGYESAKTLNISVRVVDSETGSLLVVQEQIPDNLVLPVQIVATDLSSVKIQYYGRILGGDIKSWHSDWQDTGFIPDLIKIEFTTRSGQPIPPLTVQPARVSRQRLISLSSLDPPG